MPPSCPKSSPGRFCSTRAFGLSSSALIFFRRLGSSVIAHKYWWFVFATTVAGWVACIADIDYSCTASNIEYIMGE